MPFERQLDGGWAGERQGGKNRVASVRERVAWAGAVAHRGRVHHRHAEPAAEGLDILRILMRSRYAPRACGVRRKRRHVTTTHGLLQQQHQMSGPASARQEPSAKVVDERVDVAIAHVHVPADERDAPESRILCLQGRSVRNGRRSDARTPRIQPRPCMTIVRCIPAERRRAAGSRQHRRHLRRAPVRAC